ncbi:MAG: glycosyltransferase [Caulobacteraceae bacterium]|nr:glycosyltransferase [Caulobacter sp.]
MSRLRRIAGAPRRVVGALRRYGPRNVWRFGADMVKRHGVEGALRYAVAPAHVRAERLEEMSRPPPPPPPKLLKGFDAAWSLAPEQWAEHAVRRTHVREPRPEDPAVHVLFGATAPPPGAADADWVVLLAPGDRPAEDLAARIAAAGAEPCVEVVSFDMTFTGPNGRVTPVLQPGANPWLARYADVGLGRYALRAGVLRGEEGDAYARVRAWLAARTLNAARSRWRHVFEPLAEIAATGEDVAAARRAAVARARAELRPGGGDESVSVVICTHNRGRLVRQLVRALVALGPRISEVVVVANNTSTPPALETLDWVRSLPHGRVLVRDEPFNFSRFCNAAVAHTTGERLLFLNDDITPISDDWLEPLLAPLRDPDVGIAGSLLLYPDERVQHAGIFLGFRESAGHALRGARLPEQEHLFYGSVPREVSATTGAVMMVKRDLYEALNGFDELLPTYLQDVDICMRAGAVGQATVWTPLSELLHMESTTILEDGGASLSAIRPRERDRFLARWGGRLLRDPFHNPRFDVEDESFRTLRA